MWAQCHAEGGCAHLPKPRNDDPGGNFPVTDVNYLDIGEFIVWINSKFGSAWRLPTLAEWKILAGELGNENKPRLFDDPRLDWAADYLNAKRYPRTVFASGHFGALANGVADLSGSVWEWTSTCAAPEADPDRCPAYIVAGDHEAEIPIFLRDVYGGGCAAGVPPSHLGFRLVREE
jgi:formylglycine-generating enzyme required for sulfatase activity